VRGDSRAREFGAGETHRYSVALASREALSIKVEQRGIDVVLYVTSDDGERLFAVDSPTGRSRTERLLLEAEDRPSRYHLTVESYTRGVSRGEYLISVTVLPRATPTDQSRLSAERAETRGRVLYAKNGKDNLHAAIAEFEKAELIWKRLGERRREEIACFIQGAFYGFLDESVQAERKLECARELARSLGDRALEARVFNLLGKMHWERGQNQVALRELNTSLAMREELGSTYHVAESLNNIGLVYRDAGRLRVAESYFQQALSLYQGPADLRVSADLLDDAQYLAGRVNQIEQSEGDLNAAGAVLNNLALIHSSLGQTDEAINYMRNYLAISRFVGNRNDEAEALQNLGTMYAERGEYRIALGYFLEALDFFASDEGNPRWQARVLHNIGELYARLRAFDAALPYFEQSASLRRKIHDDPGLVESLTEIGSAHAEFGEFEEAKLALGSALRISVEIKSEPLRGTVLEKLGAAQLKEGRYGAAIHDFEEAVEIFRSTEDEQAEIDALTELGRTHRAAGRPREAYAGFSRAAAISRKIRDPYRQAVSDYELARVERALGLNRDALARLTGALEFFDDPKIAEAAKGIRSALYSVQMGFLVEYIDMLNATISESKRDDEAEDAVLLVERTRSRALLDLLSADRGRRPRAAPAELVERRKRLLREIRATTEARVSGDASASDGSENRRAESLSLLSMRLEAVEAEIRRAARPESALSRDTINEIGDAYSLLDSGTVVVEYLLGERRSFAWVIGRDRVTSHVLPDRATIEGLVRKAIEAARTLRVSGGSATDPPIVQLSRMLLDPLSTLPQTKRIVIVPDGALHYLPFAMLAMPADKGAAPAKRLIESHELVTVPSISVLYALRTQSRRKQPEHAVALVGSPLVRSQAEGRASSPFTTLGNFAELPATREEVQAVERAVGAEHVLKMVGADANARLVRSGALRDYAIVHFATHGVFDTSGPGVSGLLLSQVNEHGKDVPAFLGTRDILGLDLSARLVVLSGCETALGPFSRSEGLMGMTGAFMSNGVRQVVASLWKVQDRVTAELMRHFYDGVLQRGESAAAALREAQLAVRANPRWRHPYYWAGFVVQGDWRTGSADHMDKSAEEESRSALAGDSEAGRRRLH
jgi:CHAT domain-containing protein/Tfp pilus assembly protein PilF